MTVSKGQKMEVAELKMLRFSLVVTMMDKIRDQRDSTGGTV